MDLRVDCLAIGVFVLGGSPAQQLLLFSHTDNLDVLFKFNETSCWFVNYVWTYIENGYDLISLFSQYG